MPDRRPAAARARHAARRRPLIGLAAAAAAFMLVWAADRLAVARAARQPPPVVAAAAAGPRPGPGRVVVRRLPRPGLAPSGQLWIYRPAVPDSAALPVVYYLHGDPGEPADIFHAGLKRLLDGYIAAGGTPFVVAAPDGNSSLHDDTEWGDASDGSDEVETFLLRTVVPTVEGSHPRPAGLRALAGFSMGGYGAMNIALRHPDLFAQVVSIAGYFELDDPSRMFATAQARLANTPLAHLDQARGKRVLLLEDQGESLALVRGQSLAVKDPLAGQGATVVWRRDPGAHDLAFVLAELPRVARFLAQGFAGAAGA
jgi:S-formylglutathione hydrolase FrmB